MYAHTHQMNRPMATEHKQQHRYNIKVVTRATGLNAATIRTWERRYGLPNPHRSDGGHRQYSQQDIDTLKWLLARQAEGLSIRHAAERWQTLVDLAISPFSESISEPTQTKAAMAEASSSPQLDELRQRWTDAALTFNRQASEQLLTQAFARFPPEVVCTDLLQKSMAQIGQRWAQGEITVQQEHFASALAVRRLDGLIAATPQPEAAERIVIGCAPGDHHIFSPLLLTYLLLCKGWDVYYLGANVPVVAMAQTIRQIRPHLVILAAQQLHTAATLLDMARVLTQEKVWVGYGGSIFNQLPALQASIPGIFLGRSLQDAVENVKHLLVASRGGGARPPAPPTVATRFEKTLTYYAARRTLIEAHVWGTFVAEGAVTEALMPINATIAETIIAALKLGDIALAGDGFAAVEHLLISYRPTHAWLDLYLRTYHQAAKIHLSEVADVIVAWLGAMITTDPRPSFVAL